MMNLDDVTQIKKLDKVDVLGSIEQLGNQCEQAWNDVTKLTFPTSYKKVTSIVFSGMGGSALGAYVMKALFAKELHLPFEIVNDYHLPPYVGKNTLVILASYSGTTEETLSCAEEAFAKKAQVTGLTIGGKLGELLTKAKTPSYIFVPRANPSNQPRLGTGYSIFGQIAMFTKLGFLSIKKSQVDDVIKMLGKGNALYGVDISTSQNKAKQLAKMLYEKIPIIISAEFLTHVGRVIRNQIHETAKSFAAYHEIPELNHHLMEGLSHPKSNKENLQFIFLNSKLYSDRIKKRVEVTKNVVKKQGITVHEFVPTSKEKLTQAFECIQFGAYVNYYMAMLYGLDPSKIPWVDYFKEELAKM